MKSRKLFRPEYVRNNSLIIKAEVSEKNGLVFSIKPYIFGTDVLLNKLFQKKFKIFYNGNFIILYCQLRSSQFAAVLTDATCTAIVLGMTPLTIYSPKTFRSKIK